jgi:hypothetical protein
LGETHGIIHFITKVKEEKTMVNKKFYLGILVMVLVFGMTVVSCEDEDNPKPQLEEDPPVFTWTPASNGSVSLSMTTRQNQLSYDNKWYYTINISLNLLPSDEQAMSVADWSSKPEANIAKQWVNVTGLNLDTWDFQVGEVGSAYLALFYSSTGQSTQISISSGLTAAINTAKVSEMKGYTNITNTLNAGTPTTVTKNVW